MSDKNTTQYQVPIPADVPAWGREAYAQAAVASAQARQKAEEERIEARREHARQLKEAQEQHAKEQAERAEKAAEAAAKKAAEDFDAALRTAYFEANVGASELDWIRDRKQLKSDAMRERALDRLLGRENAVEREKTAMLASGKYQGL